MHQNPILASFGRFHKLSGKENIWESEYVFEPSSSLLKHLENLPEGSHLSFSEKEDGSLKVEIIQGEPGGWRVKVDSRYIYLTVSESHVVTDGRMPEKVFKMHKKLLQMVIYYPHNKDLLSYWLRPDDEINKAESYQGPMSRSIYLGNLIKEFCGGVSSVLELGCNIGRNLNYLCQELSLNVSGVEISDHALSLMHQFYPLLKSIKIFSGDMTSVITEIPDKSYDVVFSMAALMHLHPDTPEDFWKHVVRVAKKHIITIEYEGYGSDRSWPRNYQKLFEPFGVRQIYQETVGELAEGLEYYTARIFLYS